MGIKCIYWGVFFDHDDLPNGILYKDIENKHITLGYRQSCPEEILGYEIEVEVIGYGNDDANEGYEVELPDFLYEYWNNEEVVPHITLSIADDASAKDTGYINFYPLDDSFYVTGYVGYFSFDKQVHFD